MIAMLHFATLAIVTILAVAAAFAVDWMLLRAMFLLMQPATTRRAAAPTNRAPGTVRIAQVYAPHR
ncbi:MAG: hypothetical protein WA894_20085 [Candidatus Acidiferrum sp.]